jgi:hypothetical protein
MDDKTRFLDLRLRAYVEVKGGFTFPLAGAIWWGAVAAMGYVVTALQDWLLLAFVASGLIFPLALLLSKLFRLKVLSGGTTPVDTVIGPAFIGMLLFWPAAFAAYYTAPELAPLILAVGMAGHWPVIGWSYGRSALFSAHALVRAVACTIVWALFPEHRTTWLPGVVSLVYAATVVAMLVDLGFVRRRLA